MELITAEATAKWRGPFVTKNCLWLETVQAIEEVLELSMVNSAAIITLPVVKAFGCTT